MFVILVAQIWQPAAVLATKLCYCLQAKSSKVSAGYSRVSVIHDDDMWQQNCPRSQGLQVQFNIFLCLTYKILHQLCCRLFWRQQMQFFVFEPIHTSLRSMPISCYVSFTCGFPLQAVKPKTCDPKRIPFLQEKEGFYFEMAAWINHEPVLMNMPCVCRQTCAQLPLMCD